MLSTPKAKGGLFLASSLCDGLEDYNIRQVATLLLNKDADPNFLIPTHGVTPFHLVIGNDSEEFAEEVTKLFLRHGGNPNVRSNDGMTPVHVAAAWGRINILQLLLANGGDPLCTDNDGRSPFHYAFEGKYFKAVTMLSNYCENIQDEDDKPKYNLVLDKVLITNGDKVAEYVASKDILSDLDTDKTTKKSAFTDFEPNSSSMIVDLSRLSNVRNVIETKSKLATNLDKCLSRSNDKMIAQQQNDLSQIDKKEMTNYSFIDLDFDFANLHLTDVMQKEKCLVSRIISHLSSSLASDCTINDTLHNYKRNKQEESSIATSNSDAFQLKKNTDTVYKHEYYKNPKSSSSRLKNNFNKDILRLGTSKVKKQCSKYNAQSTSKKKYKKIAEKIPSPSTNIFNNNSIVSMSPNFNTPNHRKRRNIAKTPLTLLHIHNDSIVSKSPNLAISFCTSRKINSAKTSHIDSSLSPKVFKKSQKCNAQTQSEFSRYKKYIAQSTPRRKKRSIYKFRSSKKRFDPYRYESDATSDESPINNILKPSDLDKTIFLKASKTTYYDILDMSSECSSFSKKSSKIRRQNYSNHLAIKLDDGRYDEDDITCDNSNVNLLNSSFNQTEKENESINNSSSNKKYTKFVEDNKIDDKLVRIRKNIFKTDKMPKTMDISIDNVKSACTIETDSLHKKYFVDCVDCDTKKLLNEDINMNIKNNALTTANLPIKCKKHVCLSEESCSSKINRNNTDSKKAEDMSNAINLDVCKMEKNSSLLSYVSTLEEYKYEDPEEGVTLLERRLCVISSNGSDCSSKSKIFLSCTSSTFDFQTLPMELLYIDDAALRSKLRQLGDEPGPITNTTRQVYLKRLMRLTNIRDVTVPSMPQNMQRNQVQVGPSNEIETRLQFGNWLNELEIYKSLERDVFQEFSSPDPSRRWREGMAKASFTYLLLDPRITQNLPNRSTNLTESEIWSIFLNAIFYIGKGKRSRPFNHLYDAFHTWTGTRPNTSRKVSHILDIWNDNCGVICLHIFQNVIPVEAYTREAAMIDAIGKERLGNCVSGKYYGIAATWSMQQKQKFGRYLLYKALKIFMQEGESQLFPENLG
ncbi:uncharacterized protein [Linepithema humile]|uniref:uncharacterized protein isoform X2 n=1 Tax=Linepithema humile TaxID=83485 RepID=UPI00351F631E